MFRSIRWTLQLWHALLLLLVVCVFGATLYFRVRHARYQSIDAELRGTAEVLAATLHPAFPRRDAPSTRPTTAPSLPSPPPWNREGEGQPRPWGNPGGGPGGPPPWESDRGPDTRPAGGPDWPPQSPPWRREGPRPGHRK